MSHCLIVYVPERRRTVCAPRSSCGGPSHLVSHNAQVARHQVSSDGKHFPCRSRDEPINLSRILLHLPRVQHVLESAWLRWQLEQFLPLVLVQRWLLLDRSRRILRLAFGLPLLDLGLLPSQGTRVVGEVVGFSVVRLDAVEKVITRLGQKGIDAERERLKIWTQCVSSDG